VKFSCQICFSSQIGAPMKMLQHLVASDASLPEDVSRQGVHNSSQSWTDQSFLLGQRPRSPLLNFQRGFELVPTASCGLDGE
jgi:hypothetical protein